jgi:DMSO/TMAO reductase YedYZ molybdopterin-dependent catalytic subunit
VEQDYQRSLSLAEAYQDEVLLAYQMNGQPLPPQHGFPVRLVVPGWYGMAHVKWLVHIGLSGTAFTGFQQAEAYRMRQVPEDAGDAVTRIAPRALMIPPGFPDFMSRARIVRPGTVALQGRAWSGREPVARVEVTVDGGQGWAPAALEPAGEHRWAWRRWQLSWTVAPGEYLLGARAVTEDGEEQPYGQAWNRGGFANNAVQQIPVTCLPG